jgi:hypothetical protein
MVSNHLLLNKNLMRIQISILNFKFPIIDMYMLFLKYLGYQVLGLTQTCGKFE